MIAESVINVAALPPVVVVAAAFPAVVSPLALRLRKIWSR